ncbi:hypothetical protein ACH5RR_025539 [Cinchona calisaya]|uniref:Uncharacterized protein n=1 Tax=Cinchona calisaya TaxID=153742 RepID=A0ABD2Z3Y7_9GENT
MDSSPKRESDGKRIAPSSKSLYNFTLPSGLKWGHQKHLRCLTSQQPYSNIVTKSDYSRNSTTLSSDHNNGQSKPVIPANQRSPLTIAQKGIKAKSPFASNSGRGTTKIEAVREKLMSDLKVAMDDHLKLGIFEEKEQVQKEDSKRPEEELPWNLRNRRVASKTRVKGGNASL